MYGRTSRGAQTAAGGGGGGGAGSWTILSCASIGPSASRRRATRPMATMAWTRPSIGVPGLVQRHLASPMPTASAMAVKVA